MKKVETEWKNMWMISRNSISPKENGLVPLNTLNLVWNRTGDLTWQERELGVPEHGVHVGLT